MEVDIFSLSLDNLSVGVYILGKDGFVYINKSLVKILEFSSTDELLRSDPYSVHVDSNTAQKMKEIVRRRLKGELFSAVHRDIKVITKKGNIKFVEISAQTLKYKSNFYAFGVVIDRTQRKITESLYESLKGINELIIRSTSKNDLINGLCRVVVEDGDFDGAFVFKERNFELVSSFTNNEAVERYGLDYINKNAKRFKTINKIKTVTVETTAENAMLGGGLQNGYFYSIPFGDLESYLLIIYSIFKKPSITSDILRRIRANINFALMKINRDSIIRILDKALKKSHEWFVLTDKDGKIIHANTAVQKISGYRLDELKGKTPAVFKSGYHSKEFYQKLWKTILAGRKFNAKFVNKTKNGEIFYLSSLIIPIKDSDGNYVFVDLSRDITKEIRQLEQIKFLSNIYSTLSEINQLIVHSKSETEILKELPKIVVKHAKFDAAFVGLVEDNYLDVAYSYAKNESEKEFIEFIEDHLSKLKAKGVGINNYNREIPAVKALLKKGVYSAEQMEVVNFKPFDRAVDKYNLKSCFAFSISKKDKIIGTLVGYTKNEKLLNKNVMRLLEEAMGDIEFALNKIEDEKWNRIVNFAINKGFSFVVIMDENFNIVYVNEAVSRLSGYSKDELIGRHHSIFSSHDYSKRFVELFYETLKSGKTFSSVMKYKRKDGSLIYTHTTIVPYAENGRIKYYISVGKDLSEERKLREKIEKLQTLDSITELYNRESFETLSKRFLNRATYEGFFGALFVLNTISFSKINQLYGYSIGNSVLKEIASRLKSTVRGYDIVARIEADKFAVLAKDLTDEKSAESVAIKIMNNLAKPYRVGHELININFAVGVSLFPKDGKTTDELLKNAMVALKYGSKGIKSVSFYSEDLERSFLKRLKIEMSLKDALKNKEFVMYYQPYFSRDGKVAGAEALIRWIKDGKVIPPAEFIGVLEESELIEDVEKYVVEYVLNTLKKLKNKNIKLVPISINLSPRSFNSSRIAEFLENICEVYSIEPSLINIEIVERTFLSNIEYAKSIIEKLKTKGFKFSIDDFGTGFSSLSYLPRLPVDFLKLDISFVRRIVSDSQVQAISKGIITIAKDLGIKTIAEGVEEKQQEEILKKMGCTYCQGFLYAKPLDEAGFIEFLKKNG
ncbi:EAL domain-containing protein [Hippea jasoniae]|uniref:EAL domain-containing protein n=1 Tax=Hippea jasoniae TaxID=944479 RepID=UPI00054FD3EA|nr:EAL domain-containing protein [Hippea jasoniae]